MYLQKIEAAVNVSHVQDSCRKILEKFFKEWNLPMPRIKIMNNLNSTWLGRDIYKPSVDKLNTTMEIQKRITEDEKTLDRILSHELIHHYEFLTHYGTIWPVNYGTNEDAHAKLKAGIRRESHGKSFLEMAAKINSVMGKDYVTVTSNRSYVETLDKEFYLIIMPLYQNKEKLGWAWTARPSDEQKRAIERFIEKGAKLFKSKDARFISGSKINRSGSLSYNLKDDVNETMQELYTSGKEITPPWPKPKSAEHPGLLFTHKMLQHYGKDIEPILKDDPLGVLQ